MSVLVLVCDCGGAEPLARQALQKAGVADWLTFPIHRGKPHALTLLSHFPSAFKRLLAFRALEDHISRATSFVVIIGYDEETFYWSDIQSSAPADTLQSQAILKRFA